MTSQLRVRNVYPFSARDREMLAAIDQRLDIIHDGEDEPAWIDAVVDIDVEVLSASYPPTNTSLMPRLRWLSTASAGVEHLFARDPWQQGLTVTTGAGIHAVGVAEYVVGAMLLVSQHSRERLADQSARCWPPERQQSAGDRIRGRTVLIVGYGSVGREVARLAAALGMRILAIKDGPSAHTARGWAEPGTGDPHGRLPERIVGPEALGSSLSEADFIILSAAVTPRTTGLINADVLGRMGGDAWLINVARGALIDEPALVEALRVRRIGGAVLDVFGQEPLPADSPLWSLPDCFVTPHVSGYGGTDALWHNAAMLLAENLRRDLAGEPLINRHDSQPRSAH